MKPQPDSVQTTLTAAVKAAARELGFALAGVCRAAAAPGSDCLAEWLSAGFGGEMSYLANRLDAYSHPRHVLEEVRSLVMLGWEYRVDEPAPTSPGTGRVSRYAWGDIDYHDLLRDRLNQLAARLAQLAPGCRVRGVVDTAPLLEREFAQLAGLGWVGKHTLLIHREFGSWFFLAALLTDVELTPDAPWESDHCGHCRACLDACPTQAFPAPYVLDASRCVSYLTIELRGPVPVPLRPGLGDWLFGCDICQEVCPWNQHAARRRPDERFAPPGLTQALPSDPSTVQRPPALPTPQFPALPAANPSPATPSPAVAATPEYLAPRDRFRARADVNPVDLIALLEADEAALRARFRATPLWRARRRGLLRNAAYVLGNQRATQAIPALLSGLRDGEPLVRGACVWALGQFWPTGGAAGQSAVQSDLIKRWEENIRTYLVERLGCEPDPGVRAELSAALRAG